MELHTYRSDFEAFLKENKFDTAPYALYEPVNYIMGLGGKRIRPILTMLAADLFDADYKEVIPLAFAIELFHNFSLVHDDIMDKAPTRRGQPAVHMKFGLDAGILSGDVMLIYVYQYINNQGFKPATKVNLLTTFNKAAIEVCEGQQLDMNFESMANVSMDEYIDMINKKTAALLWASLKIGATPFADEADADILGSFGRNLGIAFQLRDDYLDTFGDAKQVGKQPGGDILQNKKTALFIKAKASLSEPDAAELDRLYLTKGTEEPDKIQKVKALFLSSGADLAILDMTKAYEEKAFHNLSALKVKGFNCEKLELLSDQLMNRVS